MARPRIEIDKDQFEKLCGIQCTEEEVACFFGCSVDTVERWCKREYGMRFADVFKEKRKKGKVSLRRLQWQSAERGNVSMLIWLGKQYLGQSDSTVSETTLYADDGFVKALSGTAAEDWDEDSTDV